MVASLAASPITDHWPLAEAAPATPATLLSPGHAERAPTQESVLAVLSPRAS